MVHALPAQRLCGQLGGARVGAAGQVGHHIERHGQLHAPFVHLDHEPFARRARGVVAAGRASDRRRLPRARRLGFAVEVFAFEPFCAHVERRAMLAGEITVGEDLRVEIGGRRHAGDLQFGERAAHTCDRRGAIMRGHDQLAHHRVEFRRDRVAFRDARIHADARAGRPAHHLERARAGREVRLRILARDAQFETVAARGGRGCEVSAGGDRELFAHQIESADLFAHRVLHLQTRIHFKEIRLARVGHHELARAEPHVLHRLEQAA